MRSALFPMLLLFALAATTPAARAQNFAAWIAGFGLTGPAAEATADPDGDGFANLMEYALDGLNPTVSDSSAQTSLVFGRRILPDLPFVNPAAIQYLSPSNPGTDQFFHVGLRYRPRPGVVGVIYRVELSEQTQGLMRWFSGRNTTITQVDVPVAGDHVQWALQMMERPTFQRVFLRLRVEMVP